MNYRPQRQTSKRRTLGLQTLGIGACMCVVLACGDSGTGDDTTTDASTSPPATEPDTSTTDVDPSTSEPPTPTTTDDPPDPTTSTTEPPDETTSTTEPPDETTSTTDPSETTGDPPVTVLPGPTKGGPISVSPDGNTLAVANKATDDVTLFDLADPVAPVERARITVGDEPVSVTWDSDGSTLYVVNRGSGTLNRVADAGTDAPTVDGSVDVGSEPIQAASSPTSSRLYVTSWVDGTLQVINGDTFAPFFTVDLGGNPYAVCVTNDLDEDDDDETIFVTDFYSRAKTGEKEATDSANEGRVFRVSAADYAVEATTLAALAEAGIPQTPGTGVYPNQLYSCVVNQNHVYVGRRRLAEVVHERHRLPPERPGHGPRDRARGRRRGRRAHGQPQRAGRQAEGAEALRGDPAPTSPSRRTASSATSPRSRPTRCSASTGRSTPPIAGAAVRQLPAGRQVADRRGDRRLDRLRDQRGQPRHLGDRPGDADDQGDGDRVGAPAERPRRGRGAARPALLHTGLGRWSANGWVSCAACHPHGTTDNVTWSFPAGPRQTSDTSATFDKTGDVQRILNWTAIFDEVHDFELNTRGVAGGTGAIVSDAMLNMNGTPNVAARIDFVGPGGIADPKNGFNKGSAAAVALTGDPARGLGRTSRPT
jgi:hypothetical protein